MANWLSRLPVRADREAYQDGEITLAGLAGRFRDHLKRLPPGLVDQEAVEIISEFDRLSQDENVTDDEFDNALELLYDWADEGHRCWIEV
jgi:hypothetical protein